MEAEIIDFKTDQLSSSQKLIERAQYYAPQLQAYRAALGSMMKIDIGRIECKLLFVEVGEVVEF